MPDVSTSTLLLLLGIVALLYGCIRSFGRGHD